MSQALHVGILDGVEPLDPTRAQSFDAWLVLWNVLDTPFTAHAEGRFESRLMHPGIERSHSSDGITYRMKVRRDRRFSDGSAVEPAQVLAALQQCHLSSQAALSLDGDVLQMTVPKPIGNPEELLCHYTCAVYKKTPDGYLGSGPYMVAPHSTAERIVLVRNPHFEPAPAIPEIVIRSFNGESKAIARALESGEIHFTAALDRDQMSALKGVRKLFAAGDSTGCLYLNTQRPGLDDPRVRTAICQGIDRYAIAALNYTNPAAFTARGLLPPVMGTHRDQHVFKPDAAKRVVAELGAALTRPLKMIVVWGARPYMPRPSETADAIARMLKELGLEVECVPTKSNEDYFALLQTGEYDLVLGGWIADTPSIAMFLSVMLDSAMIPTPDRAPLSTANLSRYDDAQTQALLQTYCEAPDQDRLDALLDAVTAHAPMLPLVYGPSVAAHRWEVEGYEPGSFPEFGALRFT